MGKAVKLKEDIHICPYFPIGAVYISVNNIDPSHYFGGTWEQIKDVFLLACGTKTAGSTGGEENHTLTIDEMPNHSHATYGTSGAGTWRNQFASGNNSSIEAVTNIWGSGGDQPHNNMPPYLAVYMWKKTAN